MMLIAILISISISLSGALQHPATLSRSAWLSKHFIKPATASLAALSILLPSTAVPSIALFEDPTKSLNLEAPKNGFIPRLADVGVGQYLVKDGKQLLRLAIPSTNKFKFIDAARNTNDPARKIVENLELIKVRLEQVGNKNKPAWTGALSDLAEIQSIINSKNSQLLENGDSDNNVQSKQIFENQFKQSLITLTAAVKSEDIIATLVAQDIAATIFADFQMSRLPLSLPYSIPNDILSILPSSLSTQSTLLKTLINTGSPNNLHTSITLVIKKMNDGFFKYSDATKSKELVLKLVIDGYTHPITAANFIQNVMAKKYDGIELKAEELIIQTVTKKGTGSGSGSGIGGSGIPLELFYKNDAAPTYGITSDDDNRALDTQILPFQAYGALGMARNNDDTDSGSVDFFILKWKQALVPPGRNTLDGYYSCFGYVVSDNVDMVSQVGKGDIIVQARVTN